MCKRVSKPVHKYPACSRGVKRAPYVSPTDRRTRREVRYHGGVAGCLEAATFEAQRRGLGAIVRGFYHTVKCGDPGGRLECRGRCFAIGNA
jgi:hypothetical protein